MMMQTAPHAGGPMSLEEAGLLQENGVVRFVSESFGFINRNAHGLAKGKAAATNGRGAGGSVYFNVCDVRPDGVQLMRGDVVEYILIPPGHPGVLLEGERYKAHKSKCKAVSVQLVHRSPVTVGGFAEGSMAMAAFMGAGGMGGGSEGPWEVVMPQQQQLRMQAGRRGSIGASSSSASSAGDSTASKRARKRGAGRAGGPDGTGASSSTPAFTAAAAAAGPSGGSSASSFYGVHGGEGGSSAVHSVTGGTGETSDSRSPPALSPEQQHMLEMQQQHMLQQQQQQQLHGGEAPHPAHAPHGYSPYGGGGLRGGHSPHYTHPHSQQPQPHPGRHHMMPQAGGGVGVEVPPPRGWSSWHDFATPPATAALLFTRTHSERAGGGHGGPTPRGLPIAGYGGGPGGGAHGAEGGGGGGALPGSFVSGGDLLGFGGPHGHSGHGGAAGFGGLKPHGGGHGPEGFSALPLHMQFSAAAAGGGGGASFSPLGRAGGWGLRGGASPRVHAPYGGAPVAIAPGYPHGGMRMGAGGGPGPGLVYAQPPSSGLGVTPMGRAGGGGGARAVPLQFPPQTSGAAFPMGAGGMGGGYPGFLGGSSGAATGAGAAPVAYGYDAAPASSSFGGPSSADPSAWHTGGAAPGGEVGAGGGGARMHAHAPAFPAPGPAGFVPGPYAGAPGSGSAPGYEWGYGGAHPQQHPQQQQLHGMATMMMGLGKPEASHYGGGSSVTGGHEPYTLPLHQHHHHHAAGGEAGAAAGDVSPGGAPSGSPPGPAGAAGGAFGMGDLRDALPHTTLAEHARHTSIGSVSSSGEGTPSFPVASAH